MVKNIMGMDLAPSIWIGDYLMVGPQKTVVLIPGDQVQIVGLDPAGGIYIMPDEGYVIGAVAPENLVPWRNP